MRGVVGSPVAATAGVAPARGSTGACCAAAGPAVSQPMPLSTGTFGPVPGPAACAEPGSAAAAIAAIAAKTGTAACHLNLLAQFMMSSFLGIAEQERKALTPKRPGGYPPRRSRAQGWPEST